MQVQPRIYTLNNKLTKNTKLKKYKIISGQFFLQDSERLAFHRCRLSINFNFAKLLSVDLIVIRLAGKNLNTLDKLRKHAIKSVFNSLFCISANFKR